MKIQSREMTMGLALVGLLSYAACTADKSSMKSEETVRAPAVQSAVPVPRQVDGVFAANDHLLPVFFGLNQSKLSEGATQAVQTNAAWLQSQPPFLIRIVGYADQRGSPGKNERLAQKRANNLKSAYVSLGIAKERISVVTRGAEEVDCKPVTEECLANSRRTETLMEDKPLASR